MWWPCWVACAALPPTLADANPPASAPRPLRVVTWNIAGCALGLDGIVEELRRQDADVICLQEAEKGTARLDGADQAAVIAGQLGLHHAAAGSAFKTGGEQREAILARWPLKQVKPLDAGSGRVYGLTATVARDGQPLRIVCIHFTCTFKPDPTHILRTCKARAAEAAHLANLVAKWTEPLIAAGDFNAVPGSADHAKIASRLPRATTTQPTYPARRPGIAIDHVYHSKDLTPARVEVIDSKASDHCPVIAEFAQAAK